MKRNLLKSIITIAVLGAYILLGTGSFDLLVWALYHRTTVQLPDGRYRERQDLYRHYTETTGPRDDVGRFHGPVEIKDYDDKDRLTWKETVDYVHGWQHGEGIRQKYDEWEIPVGVPEKVCYNMGQEIDCSDTKSFLLFADDLSAFQVLQYKYSYYLLLLTSSGFDQKLFEEYIDTIEVVLELYEYDINEFDDNYDDVVDKLETTRFDSIYDVHDNLNFAKGLDELKQSEFRMAVLDHHRNAEVSVFEIIKEKYPNYLEDVNDEGVNNEDFEAFCLILDSLMFSYGALDLNHPLFIDSVELRMYKALDKIYSGDYKSATLPQNKSAYKPDLQHLKHIKRNSRISGSIMADPEDVAGLVGSLMQKHFYRADKIRMSVREIYWKKGSVIDIPVVTTVVGDTISRFSVNIVGNVLENWGDEITGRGVAWATHHNPTVDDNYIESGSGMGEFNVNMEEMESGETYYFRSYAINSAGIAYGNCMEFTAGTTEIEEIIEPEMDFTVYPNPASQKINVEFCLEFAETVEVIIMNMQGQIVFKNKCDELFPGQNQLKIDLSELRDGMYNCRLLHGQNQFSQKFVVAH